MNYEKHRLPRKCFFPLTVAKEIERDRQWEQSLFLAQQAFTIIVRDVKGGKTAT